MGEESTPGQMEESMLANLKMAKGMRSPSAFASVDYSANGNNSDELKEAFKDDWRIGMNMSVNFPLYSGNSLSTAQKQAQLAMRKTENDYLTYLNDLRVQLELIRNLKEQIKNDGAGNNYLIQHTTGSGKSYSIGWLSHLLTSQLVQLRQPQKR